MKKNTMFSSVLASALMLVVASCSSEDKYGFRLSNSQWMTTETLSIYHYKDGKEVANAELV